MKIKSIYCLLFLFPIFLSAEDENAIGLKVPKVAEITGLVNRYHQETSTFIPVELAEPFPEPTLIVTGEGSELYLSFPGRISARIGENSRVVLGPAMDGLYEVDLRLGTVTARLDPERDQEQEPGFAIRTKDGLTRATGTYFAVTEYNGQSYAAVKKGEVKKKTTPPAEPDFSAYLKKKPKEDIGKSSKTTQ